MTTGSQSALSYVLDWPQWSDYQVGSGRWIETTDQKAPNTDAAGEWIYAAGEPLGGRQLTNTVDLVNPFARLAVRPREEQVQELLAFVRDFGLLGQTVLYGKERLWKDAPPILLRSKPLNPQRKKPGTEDFDGARAPRMADSIDWALLHARNVDCIMRLHSSRYADLDRLLDQLETRTMRVRGISEESDDEPWEVRRHRVALRVPQLQPPWQVNVSDIARRGPGDDPLGVSRRIIACCLTPNLGTVPRECDAVTNESRFRFRTLIELLYWQLADRLGRYAVRQCRCGAVFFAEHGRQQSCSDECFMKLYMRDYRKGVRRRKTKRKSKKRRT